MPGYSVGLDLGQSADYTALVIAEQHRAEEGNRYDVRHLHRFPLGTSYPAIVGEVTALLAREPLSDQALLVIDATGVGRAVTDMFRGLPGLVPVTITAGDQVTCAEGCWRVPKRDLVGIVQRLLQEGRLKFAEGLPLVQTLVRELLAFRVKITAAANDTYGCWREGQHDDLVLALALALWRCEDGAPFALPVAGAGPDKGLPGSPLDGIGSRAGTILDRSARGRGGWG